MAFGRITAMTASMLLVGGIAVACNSPPEPEPKLALACQTLLCTCLATKVEFLEKRRVAEVLWRADGDAYCPPGFVLQRGGG